MTNEKKTVWVSLADTKETPVTVFPEEEDTYKEAAKLVNKLWLNWMSRFSKTSTSHEVLARVAFQFARLYLETFRDNKNVNDFLTDFERELDELVINN
ncbi:MAG: cell division protein ZapA [Muribaculaceae bacterium]|nr:cell division protein ZapA [Muribaculaceae bacterium]